MPDQSRAASEHAITQALSALPETRQHESISTVPDAEFPISRRGYDRDAVDAYVRRASQRIAELQATRTPEGAVDRALERVGEEVAGILRRAHETAEQITSQSRSDADERLQRATREAHEITAKARAQLRDLDADTDRIWAERHRIIEDARGLAEELLGLADNAAERFPGEDPALVREPEDPEGSAELAREPDVDDLVDADERDELGPLDRDPELGELGPASELGEAGEDGEAGEALSADRPPESGDAVLRISRRVPEDEATEVMPSARARGDAEEPGGGG